MIELTVLSDPIPGRRFQLEAALIRLGRQKGLEVVLDERGVWGVHAEISLDSTGSYVVRPSSQALVTVNTQPQQEHLLRNGDVIGLGAARLRFGICPAAQRSLAVSETAIWMLIAGVAIMGGVAMFSLGS